MFTLANLKFLRYLRAQIGQNYPNNDRFVLVFPYFGEKLKILSRVLAILSFCSTLARMSQENFAFRFPPIRYGVWIRTLIHINVYQTRLPDYTRSCRPRLTDEIRKFLGAVDRARVEAIIWCRRTPR